MEFNSGRPSGPKTKGGTLFVSLIFAVVFGIGGSLSLLTATQQLNAWWHARSWQPASATIAEIKLVQVRGTKGTYVKTVLSYQYTFNGQPYQGSRVALVDEATTPGGWQETKYNDLLNAKVSGRAIQIWIDPSHPSNSIVDRTLHTNLLVFLIPFATLFPLVGLIAAWIFIKTLFTPAEKFSIAANPTSNPTIVCASADSGSRPLWLFGIAWSLLTFPFATVAIPSLYGRSLIWVFVSLFPIVGVCLLVGAALRTIRLAKNGEVTLMLDPSQPLLGNSVKIQINFTHPPSITTHTVSLVCEEVYSSGKSTKYQPLWKQERQVQPFGMSARCQFQPPNNVPASEPISSRYCRWRVEVEFPDGKDKRRFDITLLVDTSKTTEPQPAMEKNIGDDAIPAVSISAEVAIVKDEFSRLQIDFNPTSSRGSALGLMAFGGIFCGATALMVSRTGVDGISILPAIIFGSIGAGIILLGIVALTHRLHVCIEGGQLKVTDKSLLRTTQHDVQIKDIGKLTPVLRGNGKNASYYNIYAELRDGNEINLTDGLPDINVAKAFMRLLQRHLQLPDAAAGSIAYAGLAQRQRQASPAAQISGTKLRKRWILGATIMQLAFMAAMAWKVFSPSNGASSSGTQSVQHSTLNTTDQTLFDALEARDTLGSISKALTKGANINATNNWGATPLIAAAKVSDAEAGRYLLQHGADLQFAITANNEYRGRTALMHAAQSRNSAFVRMLLDADADAHVSESHGWSALHYAANKNDIASLQAFYDHGIAMDIESPLSRGETPLMIAARQGNVAAIQALIKFGADPYKEDRAGENAYGWAKYFKQAEAMKALAGYQ